MVTTLVGGLLTYHLSYYQELHAGAANTGVIGFIQYAPDDYMAILDPNEDYAIERFSVLGRSCTLRVRTLYWRGWRDFPARKFYRLEALGNEVKMYSLVPKTDIDYVAWSPWLPSEFTKQLEIDYFELTMPMAAGANYRFLIDDDTIEIEPVNELAEQALAQTMVESTVTKPK